MTKSGILAASVAAAMVATAANASCSSTDFIFSIKNPHQQGGKSEKGDDSLDKFAPRFDGLRFIETLVTAHK